MSREIVQPPIAITAAHDLSPRAIATFSPLVQRGSRLLVPVQLDALVVPGPGATFANVTMAAPTGESAAGSLQTPPFTDRTREPGVYLHWALPDALTRGVQSPSGDVSFPAIPERWLVLRLSPGATPDRRAVRGWVLQAWDAPPLQAFDLATWVEPGKDRRPPPDANHPAVTLNALGHGDLGWAAFYDNVENRLAFHDPLRDVKAGPLAYLVCGWWSTPALDPLGDPAIRSLTDFQARLRELAWELPTGALERAVATTQQHLHAAFGLGLFTPKGSFDLLGQATTPTVNETGEAVTAGTWWPHQTLLHGAVVGLGWPTAGWVGHEGGVLGGVVGGPPPAGSVQVAIGNTMSEALAALVARKNAAPDEAVVLEAFQLDLLSELDKPDGRAHVDARLHASAFAAQAAEGGSESLFQSATPATQTPPPPGAPGAGIFADRHPSEPLPPAPPLPGGGVATARSAAFAGGSAAAESVIATGDLGAALGGVAPPPQPPPQPDRTVEVRRSAPRYFRPTDPVVMIAGGRRSFKHGGDGRFTQHGALMCRLSGVTVSAVACATGTAATPRASVHGADLLQGGVDNGSTPPECEDLLRELALLDPGSSDAAAFASLPATALPAARAALAGRFTVEQTAWWATRDRRTDPSALVQRSGIVGTLPSPLAVTAPARPWVPLALEWSGRFLPSPGGAADWALGEIDFAPDKLPPADAPAIPLTGRVLLSAGGARTAASAVRKALGQARALGGAAVLDPHVIERFASPVAAELAARVAAIVPPAPPTSGAIDRGALSDIASALDSMDVLSASLDGINTALRGGLPGDGETTSPDGVPARFLALRAGALRLDRLRLVDGFGQILDLAGSSASAAVDPARVAVSQPLATAQPALYAMPPRFTSPARLWFRWADARSDADAGAADNPLCGFLVPNHLDSAVELFTPAGDPLGSVRDDGGGRAVWEDAPGAPSLAGGRPVETRHLTPIAELILRWSIQDGDGDGDGARESALSALLRVIDSTRWSVDPFAHAGEEHRSVLLGHPVAVLRARLRVELREPVDPDAARRLVVPVRLGALSHWQDGLFGYFVADDYATLHPADRAAAQLARPFGPGRGFLGPIDAVADFYARFADDLGAGAPASPIDHPYLAPGDVVFVHPDQEVMLTLLVEPHALVHATSGTLPRKEIGVRRDWVAPGLARLAPTFRFGPLLVDPASIRMPVPDDLGGTWSWSHRTAVDAWADEPIARDTADAALTPGPPVAQEGWLRQTPPPPTRNGGGA